MLLSPGPPVTDTHTKGKVILLSKGLSYFPDVLPQRTVYSRTTTIFRRGDMLHGEYISYHLAGGYLTVNRPYGQVFIYTVPVKS